MQVFGFFAKNTVYLPHIFAKIKAEILVYPNFCPPQNG